jgi:Flp pilus assembly protein TadG
MRLKLGSKGQATVEAAYMIPLLFALTLLLLQPGICLYSRMVMGSAAAEGCRLLATKTQQGEHSGDKYEGYINRRLAAIPPIDLFHVSSGGGNSGGSGTWEITTEGDENSSHVSVKISNRLSPLPLLGLPAALLGLCDEDGYIKQVVEVSMPTQPSWVWENNGDGPEGWVTQWD